MTNDIQAIATKDNSSSRQIGDKLITVRYLDQFAILERRPNSDGLICITFSIPLTSHNADLIDGSGIAEVKKFSKSGTLVFTKKSFYDSYKMMDLITDILIKHEQQKRTSQQQS